MEEAMNRLLLFIQRFLWKRSILPEEKSMKRWKPGALSLIAAVSWVSAPLAADGPKVWAGDYAQAGSAWYKDGDFSTGHVYLCDHAEDGPSVAVYLLYERVDGRAREEWHWNWWGPYKYNGCKDLKLDVKDDTTMFYKVCLGDYGSPGGKKAKVIKSSCSRRAVARP
jgi:hypothetical protein